MKLALLAILASSACVIDEADLGQTDQDVTTTNKLATNKLASNKLASNKLAAAAFANGMEAQPLLDTADGRDVLTYMLQCALTPVQSITLTDSSGTPWTFGGLIGVAPAWTTRALALDEQRWVTGCLLARVNYFGIVVSLSMRGDLPALATTVEERDYKELDGAFYGNLFDPAGALEYACDGKSDNALRICADLSSDGVTTMCGFTYTGPCQRGVLVPACTGTSPALSCRNALTATTSTATYSEVVSVYLTKI